jgi:hypothetical protein
MKTLFKTLASPAILRRRQDSFPAFRGSARTVDKMSRKQLIAYARALDVELARLTGQHVKPLGRAVRFARMNAYRRDLGVTTAAAAYGPEADDYHNAFHVVFEIAEQAVRRARVDRQVERQLARDYPAATAALVAMRRYVLRDAPDWPPEARFEYERNVLADALAVTSPQLRHKRMEYWASLLDVFPHYEFDVATKASQYPVDDGTTAFEEGVAAGRKGGFGSARDNRYAPSTFLHAKWIEGYQRGSHEAFVERCDPRARSDGEADAGQNAPPNA